MDPCWLELGLNWAPNCDFWRLLGELGALNWFLTSTRSDFRALATEAAVLEVSRLDFGGPRALFWSLQASILKPPASILKPPGSSVEPPGLLPSFGYASHIQQHNLTNVGQSLAWGSFLCYSCFPQKPCQSVGGGGVPPWGPSMELEPSWPKNDQNH